MVGTFVYWPPERFILTGDTRYDIRADVWSLGITMLELAFGNIPYDTANGSNMNWNDLATVRLHVLRLDKKEEKEYLIQKCLDNRYSAYVVLFANDCLETYERRPKINDLKNTSFYKSNVTKSDQMVADFIKSIL